jgi:hypothetical protein
MQILVSASRPRNNANAASTSPCLPVLVQLSISRVSPASVGPELASSSRNCFAELMSVCRRCTRLRSSSNSIANASSTETDSSNWTGNARCLLRMPAGNTPRKRPPILTGTHTARRNSTSTPRISWSRAQLRSCSTLLPSGNVDTQHCIPCRNPISAGVPNWTRKLVWRGITREFKN